MLDKHISVLAKDQKLNDWINQKKNKKKKRLNEKRKKDHYHSLDHDPYLLNQELDFWSLPTLHFILEFKIKIFILVLN